MQRSGVALDVVSCNIILNAFAVHGRWEDALSFLQRMPGQGVTPNEVSSWLIRLVVDGTSPMNRLSLALIDGGGGGGVHGNICKQVSFNTAMKACAMGKRWKEAVFLLNSMVSQQVSSTRI